LIGQISRKELTSAYKFGIYQVYLVVFHFLWIKHIAEASILPEKNILCAKMEGFRLSKAHSFVGIMNRWIGKG